MLAMRQTWGVNCLVPGAVSGRPKRADSRQVSLFWRISQSSILDRQSLPLSQVTPSPQPRSRYLSRSDSPPHAHALRSNLGRQGDAHSGTLLERPRKPRRNDRPSSSNQKILNHQSAMSPSSHGLPPHISRRSKSPAGAPMSVIWDWYPSQTQQDPGRPRHPARAATVKIRQIYLVRRPSFLTLKTSNE